VKDIFNTISEFQATPGKHFDFFNKQRFDGFFSVKIVNEHNNKPACETL